MNVEFMEALDQLGRDKGISKDVLVDAVEAALISSYKRNFGSAQNVRVEINKDTGEVYVYAQKRVTDEVVDNLSEIHIDDAKQVNLNYEIDDIVEHEVTPKNFGRIAAQTAKQVVVQRIREAERGIVYEEFMNRESEIITGEVSRVSKGNIYINLGRSEAILGAAEQIPNEEYKHGDRIKCYIIEVKKTTKGPQILLSRTHPGLVKRLFELEVPEIHDGIVEINSISREAGSRAKIAVSSKNPDVDAVGACVGSKGARVQTVVDELKDEKIDIIKYSDDPKEFISSSLSPAKVLSCDINNEEKTASVIVPDYQLSLAIGKEGQNARLAAKLTGWKIDIKSESQINS